MKKYIYFLIIVLAYFQVNAQTKKDIKPTVKELPSLEKVLDYAEQNSHLVK